MSGFIERKRDFSIEGIYRKIAERAVGRALSIINSGMCIECGKDGPLYGLCISEWLKIKLRNQGTVWEDKMYGMLWSGKIEEKRFARINEYAMGIFLEYPVEVIYRHKDRSYWGKKDACQYRTLEDSDLIVEAGSHAWNGSTISTEEANEL